MPPKTKGARKEQKKQKKQQDDGEESDSASWITLSSDDEGETPTHKKPTNQRRHEEEDDDDDDESSELTKKLNERMTEVHAKATEEFAARAKKGVVLDPTNAKLSAVLKEFGLTSDAEKQGKKKKQSSTDEEDDMSFGTLQIGPGLDDEDDVDAYNDAPDEATATATAAGGKQKQKKTKAQVVDDIFDLHICPLFISCKFFGDVMKLVELILGRQWEGPIRMSNTQSGNDLIDDLTMFYSTFQTSDVFNTMPTKFFAALCVFQQMLTDDYFIHDNEFYVECGKIVKKWHDLLLKILHEHTPEELCMSSDSVLRITKLAHSQAKEWNRMAKEVGWSKKTRLQEE